MTFFNLSNKRTHEPLFTCSACRQNHQRHWLLKRKRTSWHWRHALWRFGPCNISETMWDCQGHADFQVERAERASHSQVEMDTEATWGFGPCIMKRTLKTRRLPRVEFSWCFLFSRAVQQCNQRQDHKQFQWVSIHQSHSAGKISPNKTVEVLRAVLISLLPGSWTGTDSSKWWLWWPTASWADGYSRGLHWSFFLKSTRSGCIRLATAE